MLSEPILHISLVLQLLTLSLLNAGWMTFPPLRTGVGINRVSIAQITPLLLMQIIFYVNIVFPLINWVGVLFCFDRSIEIFVLKCSKIDLNKKLL